MILATHSPRGPLGSKDRPIVVDSDSEDQLPSTIPQHRPHVSSFKPSIASNRRSRVRTRDRATQFSGPSVVPMTHVKQDEMLIAEPMALHNQDLMNLQPLKRKRETDDDAAQLELAKKLRKSEKKRRKKERRVARVAQRTQTHSTPSQSEELMPNKQTIGSTLQSPHNQLDPKLVSGHPATTPTSARCEQSVSGTAVLYKSSFPLPCVQSLGVIPARIHSQDMDGVEEGEIIPYNDQQYVDSLPPPPPYSAADFSPNSIARTENTAVELPRQFHQGYTPPSIPDDSLDRPVVSSGIDVAMAGAHSSNLAPAPSIPTGSSALDLPTQKRTEVLLEHKQLNSGTEAALPPTLPPAHPPFSAASAAGTTASRDTIATKQNLLDRAIADNKAALVQLSGPVTGKQKSTLMKTLTERNIFITQLTGEIKAYIESLRKLPAAAVQSPWPMSNLVPKFNWPETQFPLYIECSSDDEEMDCEELRRR